MRRAMFGVGLLTLCVPCVGAAESLYDAILLAYQTNPALRAQRAQLQATDEDLVQARAGYGPQVSVTGQGAYQGTRVQEPGSIFSRPADVTYQAGNGTVDLSVVQPLFTNGSVHAQVGAATAEVLAGREGLRQAEAQLIVNVITAYEDVRRDRETVRILQDEIANLTGELDETRAKGQMGVLTRTDIAEAEARLLSARAQLNLAQGRLEASGAEYLNAVGQNPGALEPEPDLAGLPTSLDQALDTAEANNPQLLSAIQSERAAEKKVAAAKAALGPTVSLRVDANASPVEPYYESQYARGVTAALTFNQPIFTAGLTSSRIRQAIDQDRQAMLDIETQRRGVVQQTTQAWAQLASTRQALSIETRQVEVERESVTGNQVEERVGQRTTIELLNAELELADSRVNLVQGRHDEYVARATLLASMGLLEARLLVPGAGVYDPSKHLKAVIGKGAAPWEGAVGALDGLGAGSGRLPPMSPEGAGSERPTGQHVGLPPVPDAPIEPIAGPGASAPAGDPN